MADLPYGMHWMLATPFSKNEEIDFESLNKIIKQAKSSCCAGVVGLGVMGEASKLTDRERDKVAKKIISVAGELPVTLGTTGDGTKTVVERSRFAENIGASAVMISAPSMLKPNLTALFDHFYDVAKSINIPIVMQDYPQTSGVHMPIDFIVKVAKEIPQVRYLKLEDPPTPTKISAIKDQIGDQIGIFGGLGGVFLLDELRRGSMGAMTGFAYPEILVKICDLIKISKIDDAEEIFYKYLPLIQYEQQDGIGLAIRKAGLMHRGFIKSDVTRSPGPKIAKENKKELLKIIKKVGLQ